jgi:23S rRNA (cytosine1962-C5)-methyltransferase
VANATGFAQSLNDCQHTAHPHWLTPAVRLLLPAALSFLLGYRLLNGEGDLLPGLVCDVYGSSAVLKLDGDGPAGFYDAKGIATWLQQQLQLQSVYLKNR